MPPPAVIIEVETADVNEATDLVRELERREIEAAKAVYADTVLVAVAMTDDGAPLVLEPLVAIEQWLARRCRDAIRIHLNGDSHLVRGDGSRQRGLDARPGEHPGSTRPLARRLLRAGS